MDFYFFVKSEMNIFTCFDLETGLIALLELEISSLKIKSDSTRILWNKNNIYWNAKFGMM